MDINYKLTEEEKEILEMITEEVCLNERCSKEDIKHLSAGAYSDVYEIGDKVLKIGRDRYTIKIPDNPYMIKPIIRRFINDLFIEVTEKVDTSVEVTTEELYELYKKLRDFGIVWTDVNKRNVGRLVKDNKVYWNKEINLDCESLNLEKRDYDICLKKGDLVIIDLDSLYSIEEFKYSQSDDSYYGAFEYQYKKDKNR